MSAVESSTSPMSPGVMNHSMGPPPPSLSTHRFKRHSGLNQPKLIIPQQSISEESLNNSPGAEMQPLRSVESLFGLCSSWTLILFAMARTFFSSESALVVAILETKYGPFTVLQAKHPVHFGRHQDLRIEKML